ncbi:MAG TPA: type II toxin-antitoxin system HicB family antitoxin [Planctomycetota bacterium]|jgi:predicted RNase H-like HicB family nuclease
MKKKATKRTIRHAEHTYTVILEPEDVGGYSAYCPALPGCYSQGETLAEATRNIQEAVDLYCETLLEDGKPLPEDKVVVRQVVASV